MITINHNYAIELEWAIRNLYKCDRGGVSGMADADYFEHHPLQAAVLAVAYIHAKFPNISPDSYDEFLYKYENIFDHSDKVSEDEIKDYIQDVRNLVDAYVRMDA